MIKLKHKPTSVKIPQVNIRLDQVHQVIMVMLHTAEISMAKSVVPIDKETFLTDVAWNIHSIYHTVLEASPGAAIFGGDSCLTSLA